MDINESISRDLNLPLSKVQAAIKLLDEGNTVPFIARYRKEITGNLTDADLRNLEEKLTYLRNLEERKATVIKSISEQQKLSPELQKQIEEALSLTEIEDLYRPYKPKRRTKATIAKEAGLQPLADYILLGRQTKDLPSYIKSFINSDKKINTAEDALKGAEDILAEGLSDEAKYRKYLKDLIKAIGFIQSKEIKKSEFDTYAQYADYKEKISTIPPHRVLALNRGEKEGCLKVSLVYDYMSVFDYIYNDVSQNNAFKDIFSAVTDDALKRLILPSIENEIRSDLFTIAEDKSIEIFKKNLNSLLMYPPLKGKTVLGFDPAFRTGCKWALVNSNGIPEKVGVFFLTANSKEEVTQAKNQILALLRSNPVDYIALGNGTASRESEKELRDIIVSNNLSVKLCIVNESGASVYSASKLGEEEFPSLPVEKRSAISLARRLQDPLSELVKIEPKAIGVGQYQHDMDQTKLDDSLHGVVEDCVNEVGVNVNSASVSILKYISGINSSLADNIYDYLKENGSFKDRADLKKVKKMGPKAYEQCAGFLRIYGGDEPLDTTSVHPESYSIAKKILRLTKIDLIKDKPEEKKAKLANFDKDAFGKENGVGADTLNDIVQEIILPARDIREDAKLVNLNNDVTDIKDLKVGMILEGTVRNIMDFGMFVDINVHQDGLVHISEVANRFVKNISDLYAIGDIVKVKVISVDPVKKRIGLSIKQLSPAK